MALINCPECGQSISGTARKCPLCGYVLKKFNIKKLVIIIACIVVAIAVIATAYNFFIYQPSQIPTKANAFLAQGNYIEADKLYAKLPNTEENRSIREQLYYESRIVAASQAVQENLYFPDTMILQEVVIFSDQALDSSLSTDTQEVYTSQEPQVLLHYLAQSKGGSMVDGFTVVSWKDGKYDAGRSVDNLIAEDTLPWYIDEDDFDAQIDFWYDQAMKSSINIMLSIQPHIGTFDIERANAALKASRGKQVHLIPAGDVVATATPRIVTITPEPATDE